MMFTDYNILKNKHPVNKGMCIIGGNYYRRSIQSEITDKFFTEFKRKSNHTWIGFRTTLMLK